MTMTWCSAHTQNLAQASDSIFFIRLLHRERYGVFRCTHIYRQKRLVTIAFHCFLVPQTMAADAATMIETKLNTEINWIHVHRIRLIRISLLSNLNSSFVEKVSEDISASVETHQHSHICEHECWGNLFFHQLLKLNAHLGTLCSQRTTPDSKNTNVLSISFTAAHTMLQGQSMGASVWLTALYIVRTEAFESIDTNH